MVRTCPLLVGVAIGDRVRLGQQEGEMVISPNGYASIQFDGDRRTVFNSRAASEVKKTKPKRSTPWKTTKEACELLGVSRWTLAALRNDQALKKGRHWKVKNPNAARLTYLWHVERIESLQSD